MTASLFFLDDAGLAGAQPGSTVLLDGDEGRHATTVKRIVVGEVVLLSDGAGCVAEGVAEAVRPGELSVRVHRLSRQPPPSPRLVLVQALAKNDRDEQAVEAATELGVDEVVAWQAERSVVVWRGERGQRSRRRWEHLVHAASKQSRRGRIPVVSGPAGREDVARLLTAASLGLVLQKGASRALVDLAVPGEGDVVVVVGPEGGITAAELAGFEAAGAISVRLGPNVLRSSTAGPAALTVLSAAARWR